MNIQPYLFFEGRCDEAISFYKDVLGAEVKMLMRYKESPQPVPSHLTDKVMHSTLRIGDSVVHASDGHCDRHPSFQGFALVVSPNTPNEAESIFARLSEGGKIHQPLAKTFFAQKFGMVADRFGVLWMVEVL